MSYLKALFCRNSTIIRSKNSINILLDGRKMSTTNSPNEFKEDRSNIMEKKYKYFCRDSVTYRPLTAYQMERSLRSPPERLDSLFKFFKMNASKYLKGKVKSSFKNAKKNKDRQLLRTHVYRNCNIKYGLWNNTLFCKFNTNISGRYHELKKSNRDFDSDALIIDCEFKVDIDKKCCTTLAKQIMIFNLVNRTVDFPFKICLYNLLTTDPLYICLNNLTRFKLRKLFDIYECNYVDHFNKDDLIYLSPESRNTLKTMKEGRTYILGAIADQGIELPYTLAKCKEENISSAKLPLNRYVQFKGAPGLALHVVGKILINYRHQGNWQTAMKCIPQRLVYNKQGSYKDEYEYPSM